LIWEPPWGSSSARDGSTQGHDALPRLATPVTNIRNSYVRVFIVWVVVLVALYAFQEYFS
jgi:hypothetical protein